MELPVYQMAHGDDGNGNNGLLFTSEQDDDSQSFIFVIPIPVGNGPVFHFIRESLSLKVSFPFLLGDKYFNLAGKIDFPEIIFQIPEIGTKIVFEFAEIGFIDYFHPFDRRLLKHNRYIGKHKNLLVKNEGFLPIIPADLSELNDLFLKHKGVFVGFTPNFGDFNSQNNEQEQEFELT